MLKHRLILSPLVRQTGFDRHKTISGDNAARLAASWDDESTGHFTGFVSELPEGVFAADRTLSGVALEQAKIGDVLGC
ncbi:MAG: hypothetical protein AAGA08_00040 [Pseudomonadota bacterium]